MLFINKNQIVHGLIEEQEILDHMGIKPPTKKWILTLTMTTGQRIPIHANELRTLTDTVKDLGLTLIHGKTQSH